MCTAMASIVHVENGRGGDREIETERERESTTGDIVVVQNTQLNPYRIKTSPTRLYAW